MSCMLGKLGCKRCDAFRELSEDALQPVSYTGEGPGGSTYCVNMAAIIRRKRLLVIS